jgi:LPXTG-site transpeptidase (sortase) family protein
MNKTYAWLIGGLILLGVGMILAIQPVTELWRSHHVTHVATSPFSVVASTTPAFPPQADYFSGEPTRIQIPDLNIDLKVIDGYYNKSTKAWTLTKDKVQYATITPQPNNKQGNTFLYGHNRVGVFNTLNKIKVGDEAIITTGNGHTFTYKFRTAYETNPNDDTLFQYQGAPILTVQTCSGLWYQNRQLFTFDLVRVQ